MEGTEAIEEMKSGEHKSLPASLEKKLAKLQEKISDRKFELIPNEEEAADPSNFPSVLTATSKLCEWSRSGRFESDQILASSEHPTFLTRVPIFIPARRGSQKKLLDDDNSLTFNTPWGQGRKFGPSLTVYDEDTLIAIGRLRQFRIKGHCHQFPVPVSSIFQTLNTRKISVHAVCCMLSDIQAACGTTLGGQNNKLRLDSLRRLGGTVIELTAKSKEKYVTYGTSVKLLDIAWEEYEQNSVLYIQFSPLMSQWYENEYTYLDWEIRKQLSDTGKAIHRFLSSQPKSYEIHAQKLLEIILYTRPYKKFMNDLRASLNKLIELRWLKSYEITGSGRNTPHKVSIAR